VQHLQYLGTTGKYQNSLYVGIKSRLNFGNAYYSSVQNVLSTCLLAKNVKINICKTITLLVVLYGCETWSLTLKEKHRLRVFEDVLRKILWFEEG
jgi:hypothetical protein